MTWLNLPPVRPRAAELMQFTLPGMYTPGAPLVANKDEIRRNSFLELVRRFTP